MPRRRASCARSSRRRSTEQPTATSTTRARRSAPSSKTSTTAAACTRRSPIDRLPNLKQTCCRPGPLRTGSCRRSQQLVPNFRVSPQGCGSRSCSIKKLERDDDSKKSHPALCTHQRENEVKSRWLRRNAPLEVVSPVSEFRRPLLDERRHALLLVLRREQRVEHAQLEAQALGERRLEGAVDSLLRREHRRQRHRRDRFGDLHRLLHHACRGHHSCPEPGAQ